jgi:hypothetical protein
MNTFLNNWRTHLLIKVSYGVSFLISMIDDLFIYLLVNVINQLWFVFFFLFLSNLCSQDICSVVKFFWWIIDKLLIYYYY